jgi:DNA polymerase (family 10)
MARRRSRGGEYLASPTTRRRTGSATTSPEALEARIDEIAALNHRSRGDPLLAGTESNILPDGTFDYPDELLQRLDWVIASIRRSAWSEGR